MSFSLYSFVTSLVKFIPRYFNFFEGIVSDTVFLISLPERSLFVYRNATDLCVLILYPATFAESIYGI
jgi:hypothetical protein